MCFIVYMCNFIHVGNTSVIVTGSCLVYTVNKELGNTDPASASILDTNIYNEMLYNLSYTRHTVNEM